MKVHSLALVIILNILVFSFSGVVRLNLMKYISVNMTPDFFLESCYVSITHIWVGSLQLPSRICAFWNVRTSVFVKASVHLRVPDALRVSEQLCTFVLDELINLPKNILKVANRFSIALEHVWCRGPFYFSCFLNLLKPTRCKIQSVLLPCLEFASPLFLSAPCVVGRRHTILAQARSHARVLWRIPVLVRAQTGRDRCCLAPDVSASIICWRTN